MRRSRRLIVYALIAALIFVLSFSILYASGFSIFEQGVRAMGRGGAFSATADNATAIFFNPAGIAQLKGTHFSSGLSVIMPQVRFHPNPNFPGPTERFFNSTLLTPNKGFDGEISNNAFYPVALYLTQSLSDRITVGYGVYFPFSLQTDFTNWRNDNLPPVLLQNGQLTSNRYPGRFASSRVLLNVTMHNPTVGIELSPNVFLGFGVDVAHLDTTLEQSFLAPDDPGTLALAGAFAQQLFPTAFAANPVATTRNVVSLLPEGRARLSGEATDIGGNAGLLIKAPSMNTNFAFSYRSPITMHIHGSSNFSFAPATAITPYIGGTLSQLFPSSVGVAAVLKLPPTYTFGISNHSIRNTELAFDFIFQDYRTVKNFGIDFATHTLALQDKVFPISNRAMLQYRFGVERKHGETFAYRFGYYYDRNPLPQKDVGVLQPDSNRHGITAGLTLPMPSILPGKTTLDLNYLALIFRDRDVQTGTNIALGVAGRWTGFANIFGVGFNVDLNPKKEPEVIYHPMATCQVDTTPIYQRGMTYVRATISDFDMSTVSYDWSASAGRIVGDGPQVEFQPIGLAPGTYSVTAKISDKKGNTASCSANVVVIAMPTPNRKPTVDCEAERYTVLEGESVRMHASGSDPDGDVLSYAWEATAGRIEGTGTDVTLDVAGVPVDTTVRVHVKVDDHRGGTEICTKEIHVVAAPKPKPEPVSCLSGGFPRNSARINNIDKACLDGVVLKMQNDPRGVLVVTGFSDASEVSPKTLAKKRADAVRVYLVNDKKVELSRIEAGGAPPVRSIFTEDKKKNRRVEIVFYPEGSRMK